MTAYLRVEKDKLKSQHVRNALRDIGLSRVELAGALVLLDKVSWESWRTVREDGAELRLSIRYLARMAGYSRRHMARGLHSLELRGLIRVEGGVFQANLYELLVDRVLAMAGERRGQAPLALARSPEDLERVAAPRQDAGRLRREAEAEAEEAAGVEPPSWAARRAAQFHRPVSLVVDVVGAVVGAVLGEGDHPLGTLARPVLRLWDRLARPTAAEAARKVRLVVDAAAEGCAEPAILALRGLRVAWKRNPRRGPVAEGVERFGPDRARDVAAVCALGPWAARIQAAERHAAGTCACGRRAPEAKAPDAPPDEGRLLGAARATPELLAGDAARRWAEASRALREQLGEADWTAWIRPLKVAGVRAGALVLAAPNRQFVTWVGDRYGEALSEAVGAAVRLLEPREGPEPPRRR